MVPLIRIWGARPRSSCRSSSKTCRRCCCSRRWGWLCSRPCEPIGKACPSHQSRLRRSGRNRPFAWRIKKRRSYLSDYFSFSVHDPTLVPCLLKQPVDWLVWRDIVSEALELECTIFCSLGERVMGQSLLSFFPSPKTLLWGLVCSKGSFFLT